MPIPESQLETWCHQGAIATARRTHESIREALGNLSITEFEVFLQGSYRNDTNIRGDSDVDVVAQLNRTFAYDLSRLTESEAARFRKEYPNSATYTWEEFRHDVLEALRRHFGSQVIREGNKSIKIAKGSNRLASDVIVALKHKKYVGFPSRSDEKYVEGLAFYTVRERRRVVNYPKPHYLSGVTKNSEERTNGWYKPTVRMFKNARSYLAERGTISQSAAPSYFLECLLYNASDAAFGGTRQETFVNVLDDLINANWDNFVCQNQQVALFGGSPEQWSASSAAELLRALLGLWESWGS